VSEAAQSADLKPAVYQICAGFSRGDAISSEALFIEKRLRKLNFKTAIFAEQFPESAAGMVNFFRHMPDRRDQILIYHHSFHSSALQFVLRARARRKVLIFHNVTPPEYVEPYSQSLAERLALARSELHGNAQAFEKVMADSYFNAADLTGLGFRNVEVMPVIMDFPALDSHGKRRPRYFLEGGLNILFVGRIFPNKRHQDIIKTFYYLKKIHKNSRLILVGPFHPGVRNYAGELFNLAAELGLKRDVIFTGMIDQSELNLCYDHADLFFSMSEHEGFFVPLIECMYKRLPVLAFGSSVIPETLGRSGVIFYEKDYARLAEMILLLARKPDLKGAVLAAQETRLKDFDPERALPLLERVWSESLAG